MNNSIVIIERKNSTDLYEVRPRDINIDTLGPVFSNKVLKTKIYWVVKYAQVNNLWEPIEIGELIKFCSHSGVPLNLLNILFPNQYKNKLESLEHIGYLVRQDRVLLFSKHFIDHLWSYSPNKRELKNDE